MQLGRTVDVRPRSENFEDFNLPQLLPRVNENAVNFGMFFQLEISSKRPEHLLLFLTFPHGFPKASLLLVVPRLFLRIFFF